MNVINPALGSAHMESAAAEFNLIPTKVAHLRGAEPVAVCDQDHGGVAVAVAGPLAGSFLEPFDLLFGQIFPGSELGIGCSARNCPVYDGWGCGPAGGFCHVIQPWLSSYCLQSKHYTDSYQEVKRERLGPTKSFRLPQHGPA